MTDICPRCMQPLSHEKENESDVSLEQLLIDQNDGKVIGLWGRLGYIVADDLDKRKFVDIHAAHVGAFLDMLQLKKSIENIAIYDSLGEAKNES